MKTPFEILEIPQNSSVEFAKKAYRQMAHRYHPDKPGGNAEKFIECKNAYEEIEKGYKAPAREPFVRYSYTQTQSQKQGFWRSSINYEDVINRANEIARQMAELERQRAAMMNQQMDQNHEEWKKAMRDAAEKSNWHDPNYRNQ